MNRQEITRQSIHLLIGTLFLIGYAHGLLRWWAFFALLVAALLGIIIVHTTSFVSLESFLERHERQDTYFPGWGALTLIKGFLVATLLFPQDLALIALIVLVYGDAAATLIGHRHGKTKLSWNRRKSWEGLIAGLLLSSLVLLIATIWPLALLAATIGMLIESVDKPLWFDDNVAVPLLTGILLSILL